MAKIEQLLELSSKPIAPAKFDVPLELQGDRFSDLVKLPSKKNGFYAFESALYVFPIGESGNMIGLEKWNSSDLWKFEYETMADGLFFLDMSEK
jgi:hypothetical protein